MTFGKHGWQMVSLDQKAKCFKSSPGIKKTKQNKTKTTKKTTQQIKDTPQKNTKQTNTTPNKTTS